MISIFFLYFCPSAPLHWWPSLITRLEVFAVLWLQWLVAALLLSPASDRSVLPTVISVVVLIYQNAQNGGHSIFTIGIYCYIRPGDSYVIDIKLWPPRWLKPMTFSLSKWYLFPLSGLGRARVQSVGKDEESNKHIFSSVRVGSGLSTVRWKRQRRGFDGLKNGITLSRADHHQLVWALVWKVKVNQYISIISSS